MYRQADIDKICTELLGWHSVDYLAPWYDDAGIVRAYRWANAAGDHPFDPLTSPADSAVVMEEVVRKLLGLTEPEAKMNALLSVIRTTR